MKTCGGDSMPWLVNTHSNGTGSEGTTDIQRMNGRMRWLGPVLNRLAEPVDQSGNQFWTRLIFRSKSRADQEAILFQSSISSMPRSIEAIPACSRISPSRCERENMPPFLVLMERGNRR